MKQFLLASALLGVTCIFAGCGPSHLEQWEAADAQRRAAMCEADPNGCVLARAIALMAEADMQAPPVYQQPPPQRVFIRRWPVPGQPINPAPLGYMDLP